MYLYRKILMSVKQLVTLALSLVCNWRNCVNLKLLLLLYTKLCLRIYFMYNYNQGRSYEALQPPQTALRKKAPLLYSHIIFLLPWSFSPSPPKKKVGGWWVGCNGRVCIFKIGIYFRKSDWERRGGPY